MVTFRTSGRCLISFNAQTRTATGRGAGDKVEVTFEVDDAPRTVKVPAALALAIEGAKTDETRTRRLDKILGELRGAN